MWTPLGYQPFARNLVRILRTSCLLVALGLGTSLPSLAQEGDAEREILFSDDLAEDDDLFAEDDAEADLEGAPPTEGPATADAPDTDVAEQPGATQSGDVTPTEGVEEIVIQGTAGGDALQDTSVSATTFGNEDLQALRIMDLSDVADHTPNLEINTAFAASNPTIFIRGIGLKDYNANAAGSVAIYQDDINLGFPAIQLFQLFDTAAVEILRGPQSGIAGRNATAGTIVVRSNLPTDDLTATGSLTYGNYDAISAEGALNVPIVEGLLTSRFAFSANLRDGITENKCANWNPEKQRPDVPGQAGLINSFLVTPDTILAEYQKDLAANNRQTLNRQTYDIFSSQRLNRQTVINGAGTGAQAKALRTDDICIFQNPGGVITPAGEAAGRGPAGTFVQDNVPQLSDFQGLNKNINDVDDWGARGILRFQPSEDWDWVMNGHGGRNQSDSRHLQMIGADAKRGDEGGFFEALEGPGVGGLFSEANVARFAGTESVRKASGVDPSVAFPVGERGGDPFVGYYNQDGKELLDAAGANLRGEWQLDSLLVTSISGYEWYNREVDDEGDANPLGVFPAIWKDRGWQFSQEFRAEGSGDAFQDEYAWFAGLFVLHADLDADNLFPDTRQFRLRQKFEQKILSLGPYAGGSWHFNESLSIEGDMRYNLEKKEFELTSDAIDNNSGEPLPLIPGQDVDKTWDAVVGSATLRYDPGWEFLDGVGRDELTFYEKYARAMKSGHFNAGITLSNSAAAQSLDPVDPEFIHSAEIGIKSDWFDGRVRVNGAVFRYWYTDLQVFDIANEQGELPFPKLLNADARVWGAELDVTLRPIDGLYMYVGFGWINSQFKDFVVTKTVFNQRGDPDQAVFNYDGNPLIASPKYSLSSVINYELDLDRYGFLIPQIDFNYRSKVYLDPQKLDPVSMPGYWLFNARLAYRTADGRMEVAGWVENFMDKHYKVDVFDVTREFNTILEAWGDPRTYGITLSYNF
jgi:outer membrane receptor protein involved in Fe transport